VCAGATGSNGLLLLFVARTLSERNVNEAYSAKRIEMASGLPGGPESDADNAIAVPPHPLRFKSHKALGFENHKGKSGREVLLESELQGEVDPGGAGDTGEDTSADFF